MLIFTSGLTCAIELARLEKPKVSIPGGTLNRFSHSVCGVRGIQELEGDVYKRQLQRIRQLGSSQQDCFRRGRFAFQSECAHHP